MPRWAFRPPLLLQPREGGAADEAVGDGHPDYASSNGLFTVDTKQSFLISAQLVCVLCFYVLLGTYFDVNITNERFDVGAPV